MIRILVADDQMLVRKGIVNLLSLVSEIKVVAEACDGLEALGLIETHQPDLLLLDVRMPKLSGIELLMKLQEQNKNYPSILLTTFDDEEAFRQGVNAGASGFLLKDVSVERLEAAIKAVASGGTIIRPGLTERISRVVKEHSQGNDDDEISEKLTPRETEILRLMAIGYSNREIAEVFGISEGVVKNHASSIFSKMNVRDRTRAVLKAIERGYL